MVLRVLGAIIATIMVYGSVQALEIGGTEGSDGSSGYIGGAGGDYCAKKAGYTNCTDYGNAQAQGYGLTAADAALWETAGLTSDNGSGSTSSDGMSYDNFHQALVDNGSITQSQSGQDATKADFQAGLNCAKVVNTSTGYDTYSGCLTATSTYGYLASLSDGRLYNEATTLDTWDAFCAGSECSTASKSNFQSAKSQKSAFDTALAKAAGTSDNGTLTLADLTGAGVTLTPSVWTNVNRKNWLVSYLNASENNQSGNNPMDNATHPYNGADSWDTKVDALSASTVIQWVGEKIGEGYLASSELTSDLFAELGVNSVLTSSTTWATISSTLQDNITSANLDWSDSDNLSDWAAGLYSWGSASDFATANGKGYGIAQAALWAEADNTSLLASCQAVLSSATSCRDLNPTQFNSAKSGNALFASAKTKVGAGTTLTESELNGLSLTLSALGSSPIPTWKLEYLTSVLADNASATSEWQTTITAFNEATAAKWKVAQIAAGASGHPTSDLTIALLEAAGMTDNATTTVDVTLASLQSNITTSGLTTSSTAPTDYDDWVASVAFNDSTITYSNVTGATGNGWTVANYKTAVSNGGWSNSSANKTSFDSCLSDNTSYSGGSSTCSISLSSWNGLNTANSIAGGGSDNLSATDVSALLALSSTSANSAYDNSSTIHVDYLADCINGASDAVSELATCMNGLTVAKVSVFNIQGIADGTYGTSGFTSDLLVSAGAFNDNSLEDNVTAGNFCGDNGTTSCETYLQSLITTAAADNVSSASNINNWVGAIISANMASIVDNETLTANASASGCTLSVPVQIPYYCDWYGGWVNCSVTSAQTFTLTDSNSNGYKDGGTLDASDIFSGTTVSYTVNVSTNWSWPSFSKNKSHTQTLSAYTGDNASYTFVKSTRNASEGIDDICSSIPSGYQMASWTELKNNGIDTKAEFYDGTSYSAIPVVWPISDVTASGSGWKDHCSVDWAQVKTMFDDQIDWPSTGFKWKNLSSGQKVSFCHLWHSNSNCGYHPHPWYMSKRGCKSSFQACGSSGGSNYVMKLNTQESGNKVFWYRSKSATGCPSS